MKPRLIRIAKIVALTLIAIELVWVIAANAVLASGVIQRAASAKPEKVKMEWDRAWSPWPGRAYVRNFTLRIQDPTVQFRLTVAEAHVDVYVLDLLHREFHGRNVHAAGVTYRLAVKADRLQGNEQRLADYPLIEGYPRPALKHFPKPPKSTPEELAELWSVELDGCDASIDELWFLEYRYSGHGRATGSFELKPMRWLWVDGQLSLEGGKLTQGMNKIVSRAFVMRAETHIHPIDLQENVDQHVLRTLDAHVTFETKVEDASIVDAYLPGLKVHGTPHVIADVRSSFGRLMPGSRIEVKVNDGAVDYHKWHFIGNGEAKLSVTDKTLTPIVRSTIEGELGVPLLKGQPPIDATVEGFTGTLSLADNRFSEGLHLGALHAETEAKVDDTRSLTGAFGQKVPLVGHAILGDGPLTAIASAHLTPGYRLVRVRRLALGHAQLEGALRNGPGGWSGAATGRFSAVPMGFRVRENALSAVPFVSSRWLDSELDQAGIEP
jgi:hypothetical protein